MKKCCGCGKAKAFGDFYKNKRAKDGYRYQCKTCTRNRVNADYKKNKEKIKAQKNLPEVKARLVKYRAENRDRRLAQRKQQRLENIEEIRAQERAYYAKNAVNRAKGKGKRRKAERARKQKEREKLTDRYVISTILKLTSFKLEKVDITPKMIEAKRLVLRAVKAGLITNQCNLKERG